MPIRKAQSDSLSLGAEHVSPIILSLVEYSGLLLFLQLCSLTVLHPQAAGGLCSQFQAIFPVLEPELQTLCPLQNLVPSPTGNSQISSHIWSYWPQSLVSAGQPHRGNLSWSIPHSPHWTSSPPVQNQDWIVPGHVGPSVVDSIASGSIGRQERRSQTS